MQVLGAAKVRNSNNVSQRSVREIDGSALMTAGAWRNGGAEIQPFQNTNTRDDSPHGWCRLSFLFFFLSSQFISFNAPSPRQHSRMPSKFVTMGANQDNEFGGTCDIVLVTRSNPGDSTDSKGGC